MADDKIDCVLEKGNRNENFNPNLNGDGVKVTIPLKSFFWNSKKSAQAKSLPSAHFLHWIKFNLRLYWICWKLKKKKKKKVMPASGVTTIFVKCLRHGFFFQIFYARIVGFALVTLWNDFVLVFILVSCTPISVKGFAI